MNTEDFRTYCLSLGDVQEKMPFEKFFRGRHSFLAFYVNGRMFCFYDIDRFDACTIKCLPSEIDELKAAYQAVGAPYNLSPKHWISIRFNDDMPEAKLKQLVSQSYKLAMAVK